MPGLGPEVKQGFNKHTMNGPEPILGASRKRLVLLPTDNHRFCFPSSDLFAEATAQGELTLASLVKSVKTMADVSLGPKLNGEKEIHLRDGCWGNQVPALGRGNTGGDIFGPSKTPQYSPGNAIAKSSCRMTC